MLITRNESTPATQKPASTFEVLLPAVHISAGSFFFLFFFFTFSQFTAGFGKVIWVQQDGIFFANTPLHVFVCITWTISLFSSCFRSTTMWQASKNDWWFGSNLNANYYYCSLLLIHVDFEKCLCLRSSGWCTAWEPNPSQHFTVEVII